MASLSQNRRQRLRRAVSPALTTVLPALFLSLISTQAVAAYQPGAAAGASAPQSDDVTHRLRERRLVDAARAIINPLLPEGADDAFARIRRDYSRVLSNGTSPTNAQDMKLVRDGLTYRIHRLTMPEVINSPDLQSSVVQQLWTDLAGVGKSIGNPDDKRKWRDQVNAIALELLQGLLKNNLTSRTLAITRIGQLHSVYGTRKEDVRYYYPSYPVLSDIVEDAEQPEAVRAQAAMLLGEFIADENPEPPIQMEIAAKLVKQLERQDTHEMYQIGLITALWHVSTPREVINERNPIVIDVFAEILCDYENRTMLVRSFAALGASRAAIDNRINIEPIALKTLELAGELALIANREWKPRYEVAAYNLLLAVRTQESDHGPGSANPHGFLNRAPNSDVVKEAGRNTIDLMAELLVSKKATGGTFNTAAMFLMEHVGDDMTIDPNLPALPAVLSRGNVAPPSVDGTNGATEPPEGG